MILERKHHKIFNTNNAYNFSFILSIIAIIFILLNSKTIYIKLKNKIRGIKAGRVNNCNCKHSKNKNVIEENIEIEEKKKKIFLKYCKKIFFLNFILHIKS